MKAYRVEILIIDFDNLGSQGIRDELVNARFPNDCLSLNIKSLAEKDIGEWSDEHALNVRATHEAEYKRLFQNYE